MIETAKKNSKEYPKVKVKFAVMDNLKIEFPNGLFDIVTARYTIIRKCENIHRQSIEKELFDEYIKNNTSSKGIL